VSEIEGVDMNKTRLLRDLGQSVWLDNITRKLLDTGGLRTYIEEFAVTG
jgi:transaldolase